MMKTAGIIFCFLWTVCASAQTDVVKNNWGAGINAGGGLSYTGYNLFLLPSVSYGRHTLYVGAKLALTSSYFPYHNNWGLNAGYKIKLLSNGRWDAGLGLDYQCSFYKPYNPYQLELRHNYNKVHEMFLFADIGYKPVKNGRLRVDLKLGTGGFLESFDDVAEGQTNTNTGRASLFKIGIGYKIF